jgi:hypothetical protein
MWIMRTIKEKLQAKRFRARALAGKCSCKTCYNSIFNNYIAKTSDINIIYDFVLAEKARPSTNDEKGVAYATYYNSPYRASWAKTP